MSYTAATDLLALLRSTSGGLRTLSMPGLDFMVSAFARAGLINLVVGQTAPIVNQAGTAWFKPATPAWASEGVLYLWNGSTAEYEPATPALWASLLSAAPAIVQDVAVAGPVAISTTATIVRVQNVGAAVALTLPLSSTKAGPVLISDWNNHAGAHNITIGLTGADVLPNGGLTEVIAADGASLLFRPVPGGYVV